MTDPLDQPEEEPTYALAVPFVVRKTQGGPYDDTSFVAGFACGDIDRALTAIAAAGGNRATFTVRTDLVRQVELSAMYRGFPTVTAVVDAELPEWSTVTFARDAEELTTP